MLKANYQHNNFSPLKSSPAPTAPRPPTRSQWLVVTLGKELGCLETTRNRGNDLLGVQWCLNVRVVPANLGHGDGSGLGAHHMAARALENPIARTPFCELRMIFVWSDESLRYLLPLEEAQEVPGPVHGAPRPESQFFTVCPNPLHREF